MDGRKKKQNIKRSPTCWLDLIISLSRTFNCGLGDGMCRQLFLHLSCLFFWGKLSGGVDTFPSSCHPCSSQSHIFILSLPLLTASPPPDEFQNFVGRLPTHYAVNTSVVEHLWRSDGSLAQRYRQLESSSSQLLAKARHTANKLFSLSRRCRQQPRVALQRPR